MTSDATLSSASARNSLPILGVLRGELPRTAQVLEIGSGNGHHAITFAQALPGTRWQTSDLETNHRWIEAAIAESGLTNVELPLTLDMRGPPALAQCYEVIYSCNTAHIMSASTVESMFGFVARSLARGGKFCLYGPFKRAGRYSTKSNADFDSALRRDDPSMGIRDLDDLTRIGSTLGLRRRRVYAMPSNNLLVIWHYEGNHDGNA